MAYMLASFFVGTLISKPDARNGLLLLVVHELHRGRTRRRALQGAQLERSQLSKERSTRRIREERDKRLFGWRERCGLYTTLGE
jgi:hypothetical protein